MMMGAYLENEKIFFSSRAEEREKLLAWHQGLDL